MTVYNADQAAKGLAFAYQSIMTATRASLATIAAIACILAAIVGVSDAAMARITCHCDIGDIEGGVPESFLMVIKSSSSFNRLGWRPNPVYAFQEVGLANFV